MDSDGESQRMQIEPNNPIKAQTENTNNVSGSKKSKNEEYLSKDLSKYNQFMFTPLESFLLNKTMPHGFKFETEENILKTLELSKNNQRRVKPKGFLQEPKIVVKSIKTPLNLEKKVSAEKLNSSKTIKKPKYVFYVQEPRENPLLPYQEWLMVFINKYSLCLMI